MGNWETSKMLNLDTQLPIYPIHKSPEYDIENLAWLHQP